MSSPKLSRRLAHGAGQFSPFTYSIGLEAPLQETLAAFQAYPLPQPISQEAIEKLSKELTFVHEAAHLAQYVTSSFGLRTLRRTLICNRYLYEGGPWQLPVLKSMSERLSDHADELSDHERRAYNRFFAFLEAADQLQIHIGTSDSRSDQRTIGLSLEPWSAHFFMLAPNDIQARRELAPKLYEGGVRIHQLPHLFFTDAEGTQEVILNAAALMETFALLVELSHIYNALGSGTIDPFELIPDGKQYLAALEYALVCGACSEQNMLLTVAVCIDLALMYDPFVLFDAPSLERPPDDRPPDQLPGETFIRACNAAAEIEPIRSYAEADVSRFYRTLCERMSVPSPEWMTERAARRAAEVLAASGDSESAWLKKALRIHAEALEYRLGRPASLPCDLLASDPLFDVIEICRPEVTYLNLATHEPEYFDPRSVDLLSVHNLITQAFWQERMDCPLKQGDPFYCESALAGPNTLCVWSETSECLLDLFEQQYNLRSPDR